MQRCRSVIGKHLIRFFVEAMFVIGVGSQLFG